MAETSSASKPLTALGIRNTCRRDMMCGCQCSGYKTRRSRQWGPQKNALTILLRRRHVTDEYTREREQHRGVKAFSRGGPRRGCAAALTYPVLPPKKIYMALKGTYVKIAPTPAAFPITYGEAAKQYRATRRIPPATHKNGGLGGTCMTVRGRLKRESSSRPPCSTRCLEQSMLSNALRLPY